MNATEMVEYLMCEYGCFDCIEREQDTSSGDIRFTARRNDFRYTDTMPNYLLTDRVKKDWLDRFIFIFDAKFNSQKITTIKYEPLLSPTTMDKIKTQMEPVKEAWSKVNPYLNFNRNTTIKNVIFNNPATIVLCTDGTKTVVKCQNDEIFDPEKGLAMAIAKKAFGNKGNYCNEIKKWTEKYEGNDVEIEIDMKPIIGQIMDKIENRVKDAFKIPFEE